MSRRLLSAVIIISIMLLLIWLDLWLGSDSRTGRPGLILAAVLVVVALLASGELTQMWRDQSPDLRPAIPILGTTLMAAIASAPVFWRNYPPDCPIGIFGWPAAGLSLAIGFAFVWEILRYSGAATDRLARYVLALGYFFLFFAFLVPHRLMPAQPASSANALGMFALITLIATVKLSDAFAYFVGKSIGKTKMAPHLSPGKTWQGAAGAMIGGWISVAIMFLLIGPLVFGLKTTKPAWWMAAYGSAVALAGMMGDFAESLLKRDANCKDSSKWLPGLGGILDVIDSLIFAAPVSYFMWVLAKS